MPVFRYLQERWRIVAPVALVLAALAGYLAFGAGGARAATLTVHRAAVPTEVRVAGTIIAAARADLGFAESGRILATYRVAGERVAAGTIIAELENGDKRAAVARQEAVLREARANLDTALAGTRPEEVAAAASATEAAIRAGYAAASDAVINRADLIFRNPGSSPELTIPHYANLKESLERDRRTLINLLPAWQASLSSLAPEQTAQAAEAAAENLDFIESFLDDATTAVSQALPGQVSKATLEADAASIAVGRTNVANAATALAAASSDLSIKAAGSTSEDIAIARARVALAEADLASARAALRKTRVIAPFAGVVTRMDATPGEIVSPSASAIAM